MPSVDSGVDGIRNFKDSALRFIPYTLAFLISELMSFLLTPLVYPSFTVERSVLRAMNLGWFLVVLLVWEVGLLLFKRGNLSLSREKLESLLPPYWPLFLKALVRNLLWSGVLAIILVAVSFVFYVVSSLGENILFRLEVLILAPVMLYVRIYGVILYRMVLFGFSYWILQATSFLIYTKVAWIRQEVWKRVV